MGSPLELKQKRSEVAGLEQHMKKGQKSHLEGNWRPCALLRGARHHKLLLTSVAVEGAQGSEGIKSGHQMLSTAVFSTAFNLQARLQSETSPSLN